MKCEHQEHARWGVIGLGIGAVHAQALRRAPGISVNAICDSNEEVLARVGSVLPEAVPFGEASDLISSGLVDGVVIATRDSSHGAQVVHALESGLDVFVEKPIAVTEVELVDIVNALNRNRELRLTTNTLLRLAPRFAWAKSALATGELGRLIHAEMSYEYGRLAKILDGWRGLEPNYSVTLGGSIHLIDLLLWLSGELPSEVVAIGSSLGTRAHVHRGEGKLHQDIRIGLLSFDSGLTARVGANFSCVLPHFHSVTLYGSEGTFVTVPPLPGPGADQGTPASGAWFYSSREPSVSPTPIERNYAPVPKEALLVDFASSGPGSAALVSEQEAVNAVAIALALDESVRTGQPVPINYPSVEPRIA